MTGFDITALTALTLVFAALCFGLRPLLLWILPDDLCGPDGWLIDTEAQRGIFDPKNSARRRA